MNTEQKLREALRAAYHAGNLAGHDDTVESRWSADVDDAAYEFADAYIAEEALAYQQHVPLVRLDDEEIFDAYAQSDLYVDVKVADLISYANKIMDAMQAKAQPEPDVALVQVSSTLDEIDAEAWPFINEQAANVGAQSGRIETYQYQQANGGVIVLWDGSRVHAMAVTIRDELNRTRCIRMLANNQPTPDVRELVEVLKHASSFVAEITTFGGKYHGLESTVVIDARNVHRKIQETLAKHGDAT